MKITLPSVHTPCVIASWNTLFETFYAKVSKPDPFKRMPLDERTLLFKDLIHTMTKSVTIFALQECGSFEFPESLKRDYTLLSASDGYLVTALKKSCYTPLKTESFKSSGRGYGKGFLASLVQTTDSPRSTLGVINTHLPFVRTQQDREAQLQDLRSIRSYIEDYPFVNYWFVCGDFNMPAAKAPSIEASLNNHLLNEKTFLKSMAYDTPTAFGNGVLEHIDYIFYTAATINPTQFFTIPSPENASSSLLTQGLCPTILTDVGRGHSSDHAMSVLHCLLNKP